MSRTLKQVHLCVVSYQVRKGEDWKTGIASLEEQGKSNILAIVESDGYTFPSFGTGEPRIHNYRLLPHLGCISILTEDK